MTAHDLLNVPHYLAQRLDQFNLAFFLKLTTFMANNH